MAVAGVTLTSLLLLMTALTGFALFQRAEAVRQSSFATAQKELAESETKRAEKEWRRAESEKEEARKQQSFAESEKERAETLRPILARIHETFEEINSGPKSRLGF